MAKVTPLHSTHLELGAKMADFGGWDMPIEYVGTVAEHAMVREAVGVFDVSHMGKIDVRGTGATTFVNSILTNDIDRIVSGQAQYSLLCNDAGGVVDDLLVYRLSDDRVFIVPNAANAQEVVAQLRRRAAEDTKNDGLVIDDLQAALGIIAIQGPRSVQVLEAMSLPHDHDYMSVVIASVGGVDVLVCRSGYTGELGFEVIAPTEVLPTLWNQAVAAAHALDGGPVGLGARDTLRTEMGYPLHGQDISTTITPLEAGLTWAIGWDKPDFAGRAALVTQRDQGPRRRLRGLRANGRTIARPHMHVENADGEPLGEVTSGTFSPTDKVGIAMALLGAEVGIGDEVMVDIRGRSTAFTVVKMPFVRSRVR